MFCFVQPRSANNVLVPRKLLRELQLFQRRPELISAGKYSIASEVDPEIVEMFFARVMEEETEALTGENVEQLRALCDELGFSGINDEIRAILGDDSKTGADFAGLRDRVDKHEFIIRQLQRQVLALQRQLRIRLEVPEVVVRRLEGIYSSKVTDAIVETRKEVGDLREDVARLRSEVNGKASTEDVRTVSDDVTRMRSEVNDKASAADVKALSDDVALIKSEVNDKASAEDVRALWDDVAWLKDVEAREEIPESSKRTSSPSRVITPQSATGNGKPVGTEFVYHEASSFDGIIAHLASRCDLDLHEVGAVVVTGSSTSGDRVAKNAIDLGTASCFYSDSHTPDQWICYDFNRRRVAPTSYSIRMVDTCYPKSWVLEVRNEESPWWDVVDRRDDNVLLSGNFKISARPRGSFRFLRLRQTGKNHNGTHSLAITSLEVFGRLTDIPRPIAPPGEFPFYDLQPLDGIIAHLTRECGGNVYKKKVVGVKASSYGWDGRGQDPCENVVDLGTDSGFWTKKESRPWICYDFRDRRVAPTNYSIRKTRADKSWHFEVSNDGNEWKAIDYRNEKDFVVRDVRDKYVTWNFAIRDPPREGFHFVRLSQWSDPQDCLRLISLEIFGTLSPQ